MARMNHPGSRLVFQQGVIQKAARDLPDLVLGAHNDRELLSVMLLAPGPITDEGGEEAGKPIGLVGTGGFKMTPERFGTHIHAEDRLRERPSCLILGRRLMGRSGHSLRPSERCEQLLLIPCLESLEPDGSMVGFREG